LAKCLLTEDYDKTRYEVETPLTSKIDYKQVREDLHIPDYVESGNYLLERGIVTIWAAGQAASLPGLDTLPQPVKIKDDPIPVLFFGGGAVKLLCKVANDQKSPLYRDIDDIDLITSMKRGQDLYKLLLVLSEVCGTRYYHFVTRTDRRFNAMRAGKRYRVRAIDKITDEDSLKPGTLDLFIDEIDLRHKVDVRSALEEPENHLYTIGPENVLLAKCQYIFDTSRSRHEDLVRYGLEYRILNYPSYKSDKLLIGIEEKDIKDICSILLSHELGEGKGCINVEKFKNMLEKDKKFALTFRLNLESLARNENLLKKIGLPNSSIENIMSKLNVILAGIPVVDKKWSGPWWNVDVETPQIFGKVGVATEGA
jgi:hypothetical protein